MKLKDFLDMYDNWNSKTKINDDTLETIIVGSTLDIINGHCAFCKSGYSYRKLWNKEVVAFGFYENELCIRVK